MGFTAALPQIRRLLTPQGKTNDYVQLYIYMDYKAVFHFFGTD